MQVETVKRSADGVYIGQTVRLRTESGFTHPAKVVYIHPSGKWIMLEIMNSTGNNYFECFQTFELMDRGIIPTRTTI